MDTEHDESPIVSHLTWDKPVYWIHNQKFIPQIFDGTLSQDLTALKKFNAVTFRLDGRLQADLAAWKQVKEMAYFYREQGYYILWEMDLGLFASLTKPITNQAQYLSLTLSLEHFRDVLWQEFKDQTLGISIYRGSADFSETFPWNDWQITNLQAWLRETFGDLQSFKQETGIAIQAFEDVNPVSLLDHQAGKGLMNAFCCNVAVEYLDLLANRLPDTLPCYLMLDLENIHSLLWQAQLVHPERFERFGLILKGAQLPFKALGWEEGTSPFGYFAQHPQAIPPLEEATIGICLPPMDFYRPSQWQGIEQGLYWLKSTGKPFRLIAESHLVTEWDGLDYLLYNPHGLSSQGRRKLQGFCAAGGTVVTLGSTLGLAEEISFEDFIKIEAEKS